MKNFLITGGAGFIGSHLVESLIRAGNCVLVVDNFNDFYAPTIKKNNVKSMLSAFSSEEKERFTLQEGDIRNSDFMESIFLTSNIDVVIHLAAMAGVRPSIEQPALYYDVNVNGTLCILELMKKHNVKKMIFASSSSVYGNNKKVPFSEVDVVDEPISPYAATKKAGELLCHTYHHLYDMSIACLRFFTVFGPRQRPDLAIHKFANKIMAGESIPFYGDGSSKRDYTFVDDIIQGINASIKWISEPNSSYDVFNLGESKTIMLSEMLMAIESSMGKKAMIDSLPSQPGDVNITYADISKAIKVLGYDPKVDFHKGVDRFIQWHRIENEY